MHVRSLDNRLTSRIHNDWAVWASMTDWSVARHTAGIDGGLFHLLAGHPHPVTGI